MNTSNIFVSTHLNLMKFLFPKETSPNLGLLSTFKMDLSFNVYFFDNQRISPLLHQQFLEFLNLKETPTWISLVQKFNLEL